MDMPSPERNALLLKALESMSESEAVSVLRFSRALQEWDKHRRNGTYQQGIGEALGLEITAACGMLMAEEWIV
jgi:hypothetical protein